MIFLKLKKYILIIIIIAFIQLNYLIGDEDKNNNINDEQYLHYIQDDEQYEDELIDLTKPIPLYENTQFSNMFPNIQNFFTSPSTNQEEDSLNIIQQMTIVGSGVNTNVSNGITTITEKPVQSIYRVPQSFTIFMNFQNDGTTSMQVLNEHHLFWSDLGVCRHGQRYDSSTGICRDVFCVEGFILSAQGCIPDENFNKSSSLNKPIKPPPAEMKIELKLSHKMCFYLKNFNDTLECKHDLVMVPNNDFLNNLKLNLSKILEIDDERIKNLKLVEHMIVNEPIIPLINTKLNQTNINLNDSLNQMIKTEHLKVSFEVKDKQLFSNDKKESILLFYYLNLLAMSQNYNHLLIKKHQISISEVNDLTSVSSDHGWCNENGEEKLYIRDDFHIYASFDKNNTPTYYVYVNETETLYGTGNFYLTVLIIPNIRPMESKTVKLNHYDLNELSSSLNEMQNSKTMLSLLTDVTELILEPNTSTALTNKLLIVCNRRPKITIECENYKTIQLRLCELIKMKDRSYCSFDNRKCFSINEYEYDDLEPTKYIRVCEHSIKNMTNFYKEQIKTIKHSLNVGSLVQAWLSVATSILSLVGLSLVLITYLLFDELRNIPGWNLINLTIALIIAQSSFLAGSFFSDIDTFCFIVSLTTHYGYLASFFWMNVIAFDLFRNFRDKSSHILINTIRVRSRVSKYALYGWLSPLIIVASGILVDLFLKDGQLERFKPCYAGYLCKNKFYFNLNINNLSSIYQNVTNFSSCTSNTKEYPLILLSKTCWIRNGNSNLIFFGLPLAIFIIINCVYYILTIWNIRKMKRKQKQSHLRRFSRNKLPGDEDVKFYIRMAIILGFTWITGFIMTTFSLANEIVYQIFIYIFILSNCLCGVFIFFSFVFKKDTKKLYKEFINEKIFVKNSSKALNNGSNNRVSFIRSVTMPKERAVSESSTARLFTPIFYRFNLYTIQEKLGRFKKNDSNTAIPIKNSSMSTISTENDRIKF